jgi:hypothetical protein
LGAGSNFSSGTQSTSWASYAQANVIADNQVNLADSTDNEWYITGIQLEVGDDASDFEHIPQDVQFHRCCRYYYKIAEGNNVKLGGGDAYTSSQMYFPVFIPNALRATGTIGGVGGTAYFVFYRNGAADTFDEVSLWGTRDNLVYLRSVAGTISATAGHGGMVILNDASAMLEIGAEL